MKRNFLTILVLILIGQQYLLSQGFSDREVLDIRAKALLLTQEYEDQLNAITSTLWFDSEIELTIENMMEGKNRIFYTPQVIVEDNIDPQNHSDNEFKNDFQAKRYLNALHLFYSKTENPTIEFSEVSISEISRKNYPFILVRYKSKLNGSHKQINYSYRESERVIEYRIEKANNDIALYITGIRFYNDNIEFTPASTIQNKVSNSIGEMLDGIKSEIAEKAKEEGKVEAEKALFAKQEQEKMVLQKEFDGYVSKGKDYMSEANLARLSGEAFMSFYNQAQLEFEKARDIFPKSTIPRKGLNEIRTIKNELLEREVKESAKLELEKGAGNIINIAEQYNQLRYNDKVIETYNKFVKNFPGERWTEQIDITKIKQLNSFLVPVYNKTNSKDYLGAVKDINRKLKEVGDEWPELYYERAYIYNEENNFKKSVNDADKAISLDPNYVDAYLLRGDIYKNAELYKEARLDYKFASEIDPNSIEPYIKLSSINRIEGKYKEAIASIKDAEIIQPNNPELPYLIGKLNLTRKINGESAPDIENARKQFERAIRIGNDFETPHASAYFEQGRIKLTDGNYEGASNDFKVARNIGLGDKQLAYLKKQSIKQYNRGKKAVYTLNDYWEGIDLFTKAISIYDDLEAAWFQRGKAYYHEKKYDLGKIDFESALEIYETWDSAFYYLGMCLVQLNENEKAIEAFNEANTYFKGRVMPDAEMGIGIAKYNQSQEIVVKDRVSEEKFNKTINEAGVKFSIYLQYEDNPLARFYQGRCVYEHASNSKGNSGFKRASNEFQKSINQDKNYGEAYYWKARANIMSGDTKPAKIVEDLKLAVENGYDSDTLYNKIAAFQVRDGDYKGAIRSYTKSLEYNKRQPNLYLNRAAIYNRLKYFGNAASDLNEAIKQDPKYETLSNYAKLSKYYLKNKDYELAIASADKSLAIESNTFAYFNKACAQMRMEERIEALKSLEEAVKLGKISFDVIKKSTYFDNIINTDEFKSTIGKYYNEN